MGVIEGLRLLVKNKVGCLDNFIIVMTKIRVRVNPSTPTGIYVQ